MDQQLKTGFGALHDRMYPALVAAMLFGFPLVSTLSVGLGLSSRMVSIPYRMAIFAASIAWFAIAAALGKRVIDRRVIWCVGLLALMLMLRMFWDRTVVSLPIDLQWGDLSMQILGITVLPVLPFLFTVDRAQVVRAHSTSLWLGLGASVAIVIGVLLSIRAYVGGRLATDVLNPISIGAAGVSLYVVSSSLTASRRLVTFLARAVGALAGVGLCLLSASKGPLLELLAVIVLQFAIPARPLSKAQRALYVVGILAVIGIATGVAIWASGNAGLVLWSRLENVSSDPSVAARWLLWRGAIEQFDRSPLLGDSFVESTLRFYPHNAFLESMMTTGIIGLVLLTISTLVASVSAFRALKDPSSRWLGLLFVQQLIGAQVSGTLYLSQSFWAMLFLVIGSDSRAGGLGRGTVLSPVPRESRLPVEAAAPDGR